MRRGHGAESGRRRRVRGAVALLTAALAALAAVTVPPTPADARFATGGTGTYRGAIDWFEWGTPGQAIPAGGLTRTNTRTIAGETLATTCTISGLSGALFAYRPGSWGGDGLDDMYNIGGVGGSNQLIAGLSTAAAGAPTFHLACSVTLAGKAVPLAGLVMADAEQSGSGEYVQATIPAGANWRLIDRYRTPGCTSDTTVTRTGQTLRLTGPQTICSTGPDGIAFMDGATSADVAIKGGGVSAIALGVMLFSDFGDAPSTYGSAGALYSPGFSGGVAPAGTSTLYGSPLATPAQPVTRLGATVDSESDAQPSPAAGGDGADEDAITPPASIDVKPGGGYTLRGVACTGPGTVSGWIDWNANGTFDAAERSDQPACTGSSVDLTWTVPADVVRGSTFMRLRIGPSAAAVAEPTGVTTAGEVEDYAVNVVAPVDYGDAPTSFGSGPSAPWHNVVGYDAAAHTASLTIGGTVDTEDGPAPSPAADGDDTAGIDDETGVDTLRLGAGDTTASLTVPVVNTTGRTATLYGWIDTNGNGTMEPAEGTTVTVPAGATGATLAWSGLPPARDGIRPVVRLRLTTATLTDTTGTAVDERSLGGAPDGEVEDHLAALVGNAVPTSCTNPAVETFGTGTGYGPPLPAGQTTYGYVASGAVNDGSYALLSHLPGAAGGWWATTDDHTVGDTDGRMMVVNAALAPGLFFTRTFTGLTVGNSYDFSAWIANAGNIARPALPNITFRIVDPATGNVVAQADSGDVPFSSPMVWKRYGVSFTASQPELRLEMVNNGPGGNGNDLVIDDVSLATACDFGDAPDSYGTSLAANGPSHGIVPGLSLGSLTDIDPDGQPSAAADGDDVAGSDDEDAVAGPVTVTVGQPSSVVVRARNVTDRPATLAGWIDLDGDGAFEPSERVVVTVPAHTEATDYTLDFGTQTSAGPAYARFRLFAGTVTDPSPTGPAAGGEVEDYPVTVRTTQLAITKSSTFSADTRPGDTVTYTVTVTNTGNGDFTAANPAKVVDNLLGVLDDADFDGTATADVGTVRPFTTPNLVWTGALKAGQTATIRYTVTVAPGGDGHLRNVAYAWDGASPPTLTPPTCDGSFPCVVVKDELPKLTISKTASRTTLPAVGETLTYAVTLTNSGLGDFTDAEPARFADDLSDVLDDATLDALPDGATRDGTTLRWSGPLAAGASVTVTYTVTYHDTGNQLLVNTACIPADDAADPDDVCHGTTTPGSGLRHAKTVDPASGTAVEDGQVLTYTLSFENVGGADAVVDTVDDLADVLDDADLVPGSVTAAGGLDATFDDPSRPTALHITGTVPTGETLTVTYRVTVRDFADQADHLLANALACEPGDPPTCRPQTTTNPVRHLLLTKTSDATSDAEPGDPVTYTLTLHNDGTGDYTDSDPATLADDLRGVLDDADLTDGPLADRGADPIVAGGRLVWRGALGAGDTVTVRYTVTLRGGGDGRVRNVAWAPADGEGAPTPDCAETDEPCVTREFDLPKLVVDKTASAAEVHATGDEVTYTVTVHNPGPGDYTAAHLATFRDDLADVLDDARLKNGDGAITTTLGSASIDGTALAWSGVLARGETATVTYTVIYTGSGDHRLRNAACVPASEAVQQSAPCADPVVTRGPALVWSKSVDPASGTSVEAGQELTYTLTFDNSAGRADATVTTHDDLSGVLDDATVTDEPAVDAPLTATRTGDRIEVGGSVPAGEIRTVTYTVRVAAYAEQGDHILRNALACQPGDPSGCDPATTRNPVRHLTVTKTRTTTGTPDTGDVVSYRLDITNDGAGDFTDDDRAEVVDDLSGVLDDARFDGSAHATAGSVAFASPELTWTGALAPGDSVRVTYSVTVTNLGDHRLRNVATVPGCTDPGCHPDPVVTELPHIVPDKTASPASGTALEPGQVVTYTLSWTNDGTASGRVDSTDDLSGVLDDADVSREPSSSVPAVTATRTGATLRVVGELPAGDTVTVTYQVTVRPSGSHGDNRLANVLTADTPQVTCDPDGDCTPVDPPRTSHDVGDLEDWKTVDPASGSTVLPGATLTYTLHFHNTGTAPVDVDREDALAGVLDDATLVGGPTVSTPALSAQRHGDRIAVTGRLDPDQSATVTYAVKVGREGDDRLLNVLLDPGAEVPTACRPTDPAKPDCTVTHISAVVASKASSVTGAVRPGQRVTYTLTFRNVSSDSDAAPARVDYVDHLSGVLDDARVVSGPLASSDAVTATRSRRTIGVTGRLAPGRTATVSYTVEVTGKGDRRLDNVLAVAGDPATCAAPDLCTHNLVRSEEGATSTGGPDHEGTAGSGALADAGSPLTRGLLALALLAVLGGAGLVLGGRRPARRR